MISDQRRREGGSPSLGPRRIGTPGRDCSMDTGTVSKDRRRPQSSSSIPCSSSTPYSSRSSYSSRRPCSSSKRPGRGLQEQQQTQRTTTRHTMRSQHLRLLLPRALLLLALAALGQAIEVVSQMDPTLPAQVQALVDIKAALYQTATPVLDTWESDNPCDGTWKGVYCARPRVVTALVLPKRMLRGTLSPSLGDLTGLQTLDLSHNQIWGSIPPSLGQLFRVQDVQLQDNNLTGRIPDALGNLISCSGLYLHDNQLSGPIPPSLAIIPDLRTYGNPLCNETKPAPKSCTPPPLPPFLPPPQPPPPPQDCPPCAEGQSMDYYTCDCITVTILEITFRAGSPGSPGRAAGSLKLPACTANVQNRLVAVLQYELDIRDENLSAMSCFGGRTTIALTLAYLSTNNTGAPSPLELRQALEDHSVNLPPPFNDYSLTYFSDDDSTNSTSAPAPAPPDASPAPASGGGVNVALIVGASVGGAVLAAFVLGFLICCCCQEAPSQEMELYTGMEMYESEDKGMSPGGSTRASSFWTKGGKVHPSEDPRWYGADTLGGSFATLSAGPAHSNAHSNGQSNGQSQASAVTFGVGFVPPLSGTPGRSRGGGWAGGAGSGPGAGGPSDGAPWDDRTSERSFAFQGVAASPSDGRMRASAPGLGMPSLGQRQGQGLRGSVDTTGAPYLRHSTSPPLPQGSPSGGTPSPPRVPGAPYAAHGAAGVMGAVPGRGSGRAAGAPAGVPRVGTGSMGSIGSGGGVQSYGGRGGALGASMGAASSAGGGGVAGGGGGGGGCGGGGAESSSSMSMSMSGAQRMALHQYGEDDLCFQEEDSEGHSHPYPADVDAVLRGSADISAGAGKGVDPMDGIHGGGSGAREAMDPLCSIQKYPLKTVQIATQGYAKANLLGDWGYGRVYVGNLSSSTHLEAAQFTSLSGDPLPEEEFEQRVLALEVLRECPRLASVRGFCSDRGQRWVAYDHATRATLQDHLHGELRFERGLTWVRRVQVAMDAAEALSFLHEGLDPPVVHRDVSAANLAIEADFRAKLKNTGIQTLCAPREGGVRKSKERHKQSLGYQAPECRAQAARGTAGAVGGAAEPSEKSDVFSFGVVMLELLTGRQPLDTSRPKGQQSLLTWVLPHLENKAALTSLVDPYLRLNSNLDPICLHMFSMIALHCLQQDPEDRPRISEVHIHLVELLHHPGTRTSAIPPHLHPHTMSGGPEVSDSMMDSVGTSNTFGSAYNNMGQQQFAHQRPQYPLEEDDEASTA